MTSAVDDVKKAVETSLRLQCVSDSKCTRAFGIETTLRDHAVPWQGQYCARSLLISQTLVSSGEADTVPGMQSRSPSKLTENRYLHHDRTMLAKGILFDAYFYVSTPIQHIDNLRRDNITTLCAEALAPSILDYRAQPECHPPHSPSVHQIQHVRSRPGNPQCDAPPPDGNVSWDPGWAMQQRRLAHK